MNNRDTIIYSNYHEKAILEHHGKDYGVTAKLSCQIINSRNDGDGIITPRETTYDYDFIIESLEIYDHDGNDLDFSNRSVKELIQDIESEIIEFCQENTDKFYN